MGTDVQAHVSEASSELLTVATYSAVESAAGTGGSIAKFLCYLTTILGYVCHRGPNAENRVKL
jgi:hypothetical protein